MKSPVVAETLGPLDDRPWPEDLAGRVATPGPAPRIHGYAVEDDLARHYRFLDSAYLCAVGELPSEGASRALDVVCQFLLPTPVSEGPAHAAVLARTCGADLSATLSVAAIALAEQTRACLEGHDAWLRWLSDPQGDPPAEFLSEAPQDRASVERLALALAPSGIHIAVLQQLPTRMASMLAVLHGCGLRTAEQLAPFIVMAKLPCVMAEAHATALASFLDYPIHLPAFQPEVSR